VRAVKLSARHVGGMLAVVVGAVLVSAALAAPPDDSADPRGPGAVAGTSVVTSVRPDDQAEARGPGALSSSAVERDPGWTTLEPVATETSGFDWTYVAVALVVAAAAAFLVGGAILTARHYGGPGRLAPH
jgi:hypothetical protein